MDPMNILFHIIAALVSLSSFLVAVWAAKNSQAAKHREEIDEMKHSMFELDKKITLAEEVMKQHIKTDEEFYALMRNHIFSYDEFVQAANRDKEFAVLQTKVENDEKKAAEMYSLFIDFMRSASLSAMRVSNIKLDQVAETTHRDPKDPSKW